MIDYGDARSIRRASGAILIDGHHVADTVQCVHCGTHWVPQRGSGRLRGFCLRCGGVTCGAASCDACVPFEQRLDRRDGG